MNTFLAILIPAIFILSFGFAIAKKVRVFDSFSEGVKGAIPLILSVFPYIAAITMLSKLLEISGLGNSLFRFFAPVFSFVGIPEEIAPLLLIKPLSGGGGIAVLSDILEKFGADSYISRCACVIYGASETIFYVGAVYFAGLKRKKFNTALTVVLFSYIATCIFACFLCRIL
jgi:spore maturation protein B